VASAVVRFDRHVVAQGISSLVSCLWPFREKRVGHVPVRENLRFKFVIDMVVPSLFSPGGGLASTDLPVKADGGFLKTSTQ